MDLGEPESLIGELMLPRAENEGVEDCAVQPESIREALNIAAAAVKSVVSTVGERGDSKSGCVEVPWEDSSDALVGIADGVTGPSESCETKKGGVMTETAGDKVDLVGGDLPEQKVDTVAVPGLPETGEACVDGLHGNEKGDSGVSLGAKLADQKDDVDDDAETDGRDQPTLAEDFAV